MIDFSQVKSDAVGRWDGIFQHLGIDVGDGHHKPCPICGGVDRFRYDNKKCNGTWICNNCGAGDGWKLVQEVLGCSFKDAISAVAQIVGTVQVSSVPRSEPSITPDILRGIYLGSEPASQNNLVGVYLRNRGLNMVPATLRYAKECWEPEYKRNEHAMLATFTMPNGKAVTMHRTYLTGGGLKLGIEKPKKILPSLEKMTGGAVRLWPIPEDGIIGVAEGIETAIAACEDFQRPVWPTLTSSLLEGFVPPSGVRHVAVFADNDRNFAGQKAAYVLANRLVVLHHITADVFVPAKAGDDWLDDKNRRNGIEHG